MLVGRCQCVSSLLMLLVLLLLSLSSTPLRHVLTAWAYMTLSDMAVVVVVVVVVLHPPVTCADSMCLHDPSRHCDRASLGRCPAAASPSLGAVAASRAALTRALRVATCARQCLVVAARFHASIAARHVDQRYRHRYALPQIA